MKTKKNQLTNLLKTGVFLFGIFLLLWSCQKEESFIEQETNIVQHSQTYQKISAKEIPEIIITLKDKFKLAKTSDTKSKSSQINIFNLLDLDSIVKIKTLENDISYSIRLKENKEKIINVVAITKNDSNTNYYIYEYTPTPSFTNLYNLGIKSMGEFEGKLHIYTIEEYLEEQNTKNKSTFSPCGDIIFDGGNTDPTGDTNTNTGSSTYDCVISITTHHVCPYGGTNHDESVCGPDGTGPGAPYYTVEWDCTINTSQKTTTKNISSDPCIGGGDTTSNNITTPVGINQPPVVPCEENGCEIEFINNVLNNVPNLTLEQVQWVSDLNNIRTVVNISDFIDNIVKIDPNADSKALEFVFEAYRQNKIYNNFDSSFLNSVNQFIDIDVTTLNPDLAFQLQLYFTTKCAVLRYNNPTWSDAKIYWEASKDLVHIALDGFGMIPVVGEIADLTNGVLYLIEGDGVNATLSFAATIPIAGWAATGTKYAIKVVDASQTASTIVTKVKLTWKVLADGTIYFGSNSTCRRQLRKALGLAPYAQDARQAHHIIPLNKQTNSVVQKAAKSENAFHLNEALNGIRLDNTVHLGSHTNYDNRVLNFLNQLPANATPNQAFEHVSTLINKIKTAINNNPTTHIDNLIF